MPTRDLDELIDDSYKLPVSGKIYTVPGPDAETGLWCLRMVEAATSGQPVVLNDPEELTLYQRVLGSAYDEMVADKVSMAKIAFCGQTALVWITQGPVAADMYWDTAGKGPTPNRANRRSTTTGGVTETNAPASTNGTRRPRKSLTNSPAKATRSRGRTS